MQKPKNISPAPRTMILNAPKAKGNMSIPVFGNRQGTNAPVAAGNKKATEFGNNSKCVNAPVASIKVEAPVCGNRQGASAPVGRPTIKIGHRA